MDDRIAVGVKVFTRDRRVKSLLNSVPSWVSKVYIADDGEHTTLKEELYNSEYEFDKEVIDLEYDTGIGRSRESIVNTFTEEYLLIIDSDHLIPDDGIYLYEQLKQRPELGGIGGAIVEPEKDRLYCEAQDLLEEQTQSGLKLIRGPRVNDKKEIEMVCGLPLIKFDFIPNAALFRRECLEEQSWDPEFVIGGEHIDFYVSHWKGTDWEFAVSPSIQFAHHPGGSAEYLNNRHSEKKTSASDAYFKQKWGYDKFESKEWAWFDTNQPQYSSTNKLSRAVDIYIEDGVSAVLRKIKQYAIDK